MSHEAISVDRMNYDKLGCILIASVPLNGGMNPYYVIRQHSLVILIGIVSIRIYTSSESLNQVIAVPLVAVSDHLRNSLQGERLNDGEVGLLYISTEL